MRSRIAHKPHHSTSSSECLHNCAQTRKSIALQRISGILTGYARTAFPPNQYSATAGPSKIPLQSHKTPTHRIPARGAQDAPRLPPGHANSHCPPVTHHKLCGNSQSYKYLQDSFPPCHLRLPINKD